MAKQDEILTKVPRNKVVFAHDPTILQPSYINLTASVETAVVEKT